MSSTPESRQQQKSQLAVQREIRLVEDHLVIWIQEHLDKKHIYGKLDSSQFRNLMRIADGTESPEVIKNFLRYQLGRDNKWGKGPDSLAEKIIADIGEATTEKEGSVSETQSQARIYNLAKEIAERTQSTDFKLIWMNLIRRYIGFGGRHLVYVNKGGGQ